VGDQVEVQIAEIKVDDRRLTLRPPSDGQDESWKNYQSSQQQNTSSFGGSLGDQLKQMMDKNKK
jgi:hypothetical protein